MGCGSSKQQEAQPERRVRIRENPPPVPEPSAAESLALPSAPRSTIVSVARSTQDGIMAEQESFVKSLPSESRFILTTTLANMMDLGLGSASPADFIEREQLYQTLRMEMPTVEPTISEIPVTSNGNSRPATLAEAEWARNLTQSLCVAYKSIHISSNTSIILPFLPIPNQE